MTTACEKLNSRAFAALRIRPVVDAAIILVVSICVALLRVICTAV